MSRLCIVAIVAVCLFPLASVAQRIGPVTMSDATVVEGDTGSRVVLVTVACGPSDKAWDFQIRLRNGTATATDYSSYASVQFGFPAHVPASGANFKLQLEVYGDLEPEPDEYFYVDLYIDEWTPRPSARITIVDDDPGMTVAPTAERGSDIPVVVDCGCKPPVPVPGTLFVSADPSVLAVPATVPFPAGSRQVSFKVRAVERGRTDLVVTFSPSLAGRTLTAPVRVLTSASVAFTPAAITVVRNNTATTMLSISPPQDEPVVVMLRGNSALEVPNQAVTIPPHGSVPVTIKGILLGGSQTIAATTPIEYGGATTALAVLVRGEWEIARITSIAPAAGTIGGGTSVRISGTQLRNDCTLRFGGVPVSGVQFVSSTEMIAFTPPRPAGAVDVLLQCGDETFTSTGGFTYTHEKPSPTSISPSFGSKSGGTLVRIAGTNLDGACGVTFDGVSASNISLEGPGSMIATAPLHAAGRVAIGVRCEGGSATLGGAYSFLEGDDPAPSIASLSALTAAPGETVTITGAWFRPSDAITFAGAAAEILRTAPDVQIVRVPDLAAVTVPVTLRDASDRVSTTGPIFDVKPFVAPRISTVTPSTAWPGAEIELTGQGLRPALRFVIDGIEARVIDLDATHVRLRVPDGVHAGNATIVASGAWTPDATATIALQSGGVAIRSASPRCTMISGNAAITLSGDGFAPNAVVAFDGVSSPSVTFIDAKTLRAVAPGSLAGPARITVTNPSGEAATLTNGFTFLSPMQPDTPCGDRRRSARR